MRFWREIFKTDHERRKNEKTEDYGKKKIVENKKKLQGDQDGSWNFCEGEIFSWILKIMWYNAIENLAGGFSAKFQKDWSMFDMPTLQVSEKQFMKQRRCSLKIAGKENVQWQKKERNRTRVLSQHSA